MSVPKQLIETAIVRNLAEIKENLDDIRNELKLLRQAIEKYVDAYLKEQGRGGLHG